MWRLGVASALGLFLVLPGVLVGLELFAQAQGDDLLLVRPSDLTVARAPRHTYVATTLGAADVEAILPLPQRHGALLRLATGAHGDHAYVFAEDAKVEVLRGSGRLVVDGRIQSALSGGSRAELEPVIPGVSRDERFVLLVDGETRAEQQPPILGGFGVAALGTVGMAELIRRWRRGRRPVGLDFDDGLGWWERAAHRRPRVFASLESLSFNGFGLRWLDFHGGRDDGSFLATQWLTAGFLPIAPVRRERLRVGDERSGGEPLRVAWSSQPIERLERLPVDHGRSLRIYGFYFLLWLPALAGPPIAGLAWVVSHGRGVPAWLFGFSALAVFGWGVICVALERRLMGPRH